LAAEERHEKREGDEEQLRPHPSVLARYRAGTHSVPKTFHRQYGGASIGDMAAYALIDTGAILPLLDRSGRWHEACADAFEAALTELFHVVGDSRYEMEIA
jgi:hypothetical protein